MEITICQIDQNIVIGLFHENAIQSYWSRSLSSWVPTSSMQWASVWSSQKECLAYLDENRSLIERPLIMAQARSQTLK